MPNVTTRDVTERPETIEVGSNILAGVEVQPIADAVALVTSTAPSWTPPPEYLMNHVAATVHRILTGARG